MGSGEQVFRVDLHGVVDLLSSAIYSSPRVYLRELIQNATDAITARSQRDPAYRTVGIRISPLDVAAPDTFTITDDGIGLTPDEVERFLATVGSSSKRDLFDLPRSDFLGRFGIGMLSALMVATAIDVETRSVSGGPALRWVGRGDGSYATTVFDAETTAGMPFGTRVTLHPRPDDAPLLRQRAVVENAQRYARFLAIPIHVDLAGGGSETITEPAVFLTAASRGITPEVVQFGRELLGAQPFDVIPLDIPETGTRGVAYVLPAPPPPSARQAHHVYLGGMLVSHEVRDLAPDWAFFVRCVVSSTELTPTASREQIVDNATLAATRDAIGAALRSWMLGLERHHPLRLAAFVATHHLALKALVVHGDELAPLIVRLIPMETSRGLQSIAEIVAHDPVIRVVDTTDQFRQVVALSNPQDPIVNCGHTYDHEVIARLPDLIPGVVVRPVSVSDVVDRLRPVDPRDLPRATALEAAATRALAPWQTVAAARLVDNADVPALVLTDPDVIRRTERARARDSAPGLWSRLLAATEDTANDASAATGAAGAGESAGRGPAPAARLVLNWANPFIRTLADSTDEVTLARVVRLLHLQAIVSSGRPLTPAENADLTAAMSDLIALALPTEGDPS